MRSRIPGFLCTAALATAIALLPRAGMAGTNFLAVADTSACTNDPAASTTVPGWITIGGSPQLLCADVADVAAAGAASILPGRIGSGPYGSATLERMIDLRADGAAIDRGTVRYTISGWLGSTGSGHARTILTLIFHNAAGRPLRGSVQLEGPVASVAGVGGRAAAFTARSASGRIPHGTRSLRVVLQLTNTDPAHDAAYAERLRLELQPAPDLPPPSPPPSRVPRFDHVFLIMMENTRYRQVIGDTKDAPYINGLAARGTLLARYHAVYHPSDENYLAIADGATTVRGAIYFPNMRLAVRHIGDTIEAAGKTWKAYEQGMGTPCNTTKQFDKYYEPDDAPFINYADVIDDPARCRAHLFDTSQMATDLASAAATPDFAWIAADDYDDGEDAGNGSPQSLRVQDAWLERTLAPLFVSPAWRGQRSLLILTWDESSTMRTNHVATILVGSRHSVRRDFVSRVRYDHYSTGRTIEEALGLPTLTANDRYARTIDDAFVK
ncbi:MAG TPA: alkaline phosphatase family protein [Steroidobacteraceae bacterium]|nr:alkaline phosphatase family protein [Steroidobacteraceae bacterium]